ncbi:DUF2391 family protein [Corallococcus sp. BB11-1]|uniref:DUF2391 family protein n=1 Tax=Corallococcus sp. BB11-1 TaxID=2996783 RepID=UPI00226E6B35|nr:DUF2391 family protein [Corallococcus sp. BB11-1]MCY1030949.1 DUF2391 family protein [Corallococcus sp. BB11-1]
MASAPPAHAHPHRRPVRESLREYGRGIAGGLLFSLPLLYTMEVWWAGFTSHPLSVLGYLVGTYVLLLGYNRYGGFRRDVSWFDVFTDSLEELGMGLVVSAGVLVLWFFGRFAGNGLGVCMAQVVVLGLASTLGASAGRLLIQS